MSSTVRVKVEENPEPVRSAAVAAESYRSGAFEIDDDDDDDEVVREIEVHLSPQMAQQLYLLQYPLQHADDKHETPPKEARIKPKHGMLEITHRLPRAMEVMETSDFRGMEERIFHSQTIPIHTNICLGKLSPASCGIMHLVPLTHIYQMRPSFSHVDEREALTSTTTTEEAERAAAAANKASEKKPLAFQRKESERAAMLRKSSYDYKKSSEATEEWNELTVHRGDSSEQAAIMEKIYAEYEASKTNFLLQMFDEEDQNNVADPNIAYVQTLNYLPATTTTGPLQYLGNDLKSVASRLTSLMLKGFPIPYSILRAQFDTSQVSDQVLTKALSVCAVMVRGNYCLNSKFLAALPDRLKRARTFILLVLQRRRELERRRLVHVYSHENGSSDADSVSPESLLVLLRQVAKQTSTCWVLKIEDDEGHTTQFPEALDIHEEYWTSQSDRFQRELTAYDAA